MSGKRLPELSILKWKIMKMTTPFGSILMVWVILSCQAGFAQIPGPAVGLLNPSNEKSIKGWYTAFVNKDWNLMEQVLADGFTFSSPLDDHIDLKTYKERCWPNSASNRRILANRFSLELKS